MDLHSDLMLAGCQVILFDVALLDCIATVDSTNSAVCGAADLADANFVECAGHVAVEQVEAAEIKLITYDELNRFEAGFARDAVRNFADPDHKLACHSIV